MRVRRPRNMSMSTLPACGCRGECAGTPMCPGESSGATGSPVCQLRSRECARDLVLQRLPDLLAELRGVLVAVRGYRVRYGRVEDVLLAPGHRHVAAALARHLPAVDVLAGHCSSNRRLAGNCSGQRTPSYTGIEIEHRLAFRGADAGGRAHRSRGTTNTRESAYCRQMEREHGAHQGTAICGNPPVPSKRDTRDGGRVGCAVCGPEPVPEWLAAACADRSAATGPRLLRVPGVVVDRLLSDVASQSH